jgi:hypothetical protein
MIDDPVAFVEGGTWPSPDSLPPTRQRPVGLPVAELPGSGVGA